MMRRDQAAFEAMVTRHRSLEERLALKVASLLAAARTGGDPDGATAEVLALFRGDILPQLVAEERSIVVAARGLPTLRATVAVMEAQHERVIEAAARLARAVGANEAAQAAELLSVLFSAHVEKENELLLRCLLVERQVDLAGLLDQMEHALGEILAARAVDGAALARVVARAARCRSGSERRATHHVGRRKERQVARAAVVAKEVDA